MKILALITSTNGESGGIAEFNRHFLRALGEEKEVFIVNRSRQAPLSKFIFILKTFLAIFNRRSFDFIFCGHLHLAPLAALLKKLTGIPFWLQLHGIEAWQKPSGLIQRAVKEATLVTAVSRYTRRKFLAWADVDPEKVRVLPNTFDSQFCPGPKSEPLLKRCRLDGKKILLTVGRLSASEKYKGHDRMIRLMPDLLRKIPNLVYWIVGEGDDRARLEALAQQENLKSAVVFAGGIEKSELVDIYRTADLFVMPSTGEGFGIAFLEAAACGIPVIAGNQDGSVDALLEGKLGSLVKPDDREEIIQAVERNLFLKKTSLDQVQRFSNSNFRDFIKTLTQEEMSLNGKQK